MDFTDYKLSVSDEQIKQFIKKSTFSPQKRKELDLWSKLKVSENKLTSSTNIDSYLAVDIAEFIRQELLSNDISFTYETVMSYSGKIDFLRLAIEKGYRVYLYFIATEDPEINISRIKLISEITNGSEVALNPEIDVPNWVSEYLLNIHRLSN